MAGQVDTDIMTIFNGGFDSSRRVAAIQDALTAATWGEKFLEAVTKLKRFMSVAHIPQDGRWLMIHPETLEGIENYFLTKGATGVYLPQTGESVRKNGFAGTLLGFRLLVATKVPDGDQIASKDTRRLFAGRGTEAVTHANQIIQTEGYRPEKRFADAVKGLNVYGTKMVLPTRLWTIEHLQAA